MKAQLTGSEGARRATQATLETSQSSHRVSHLTMGLGKVETGCGGGRRNVFFVTRTVPTSVQHGAFSALAGRLGSNL